WNRDPGHALGDLRRAAEIDLGVRSFERDVANLLARIVRVGLHESLVCGRGESSLDMSVTVRVDAIVRRSAPTEGSARADGARRTQQPSLDSGRPRNLAFRFAEDSVIPGEIGRGRGSVHSRSTGSRAARVRRVDRGVRPRSSRLRDDPEASGTLAIDAVARAGVLAVDSRTRSASVLTVDSRTRSARG